MPDFKRFPETRKIRTVSLDTNILSDAMYYLILESKGKLTKKPKPQMERFSDSMQALTFILSVNVEPIGTELVRKELKRKLLFARLYDAVFGRNQIKITKEVKWLAKKYVKKTKIDNPDALIMASASRGGVDLFLSWNRDDMVNSKNLEKIAKINKKGNIPLPTFATPKEFLDRVFLTDSNTICLSQLPTPRRFHLKSFWTR